MIASDERRGLTDLVTDGSNGFLRAVTAAPGDANGRENPGNERSEVCKTYEFVLKDAGLKFAGTRPTAAKRLSMMRIEVRHDNGRVTMRTRPAAIAAQIEAAVRSASTSE